MRGYLYIKFTNNKLLNLLIIVKARVNQSHLYEAYNDVSLYGQHLLL